MSMLAAMGHALVVSHVVALIVGIVIGMCWMWHILNKGEASNG